MKLKIPDIPVDYPKTVLLLTLLAIILATLGMKNLYFRGDYQIFFDADNPQLQAFQEIEATFNKTDTISIVVAPESGTVFTPAYLAMIRDITEAAWQTPYSSRVDSIANYQHTSADGDDLLVEDLLFDGRALTPLRIAQVKAIATNEPRLKNLLVSEKGDVAVINVTLQLPAGDQTVLVAEIHQFVKDMTANYQQAHPDVIFHLGGIIALNYAFAEAAMADGSTLVPLMFLVVLVLLGVMLRSVNGVLATLMVIIATVAATLGLLGWAGKFLNNGTVNVPTLIMTLAVADCVHVITLVLQSMRRGMSKTDAIKHSLRTNGMALLITSLTTAVGFLMMNASDSPVLRDMGNLSAVGVVIAFVLAITLLPAMLALLPLRVKSQPDAVDQSHFSSFGWLADWVIVRYRGILMCAVVLVSVSTVLLTHNSVNDDSIEYFDSSYAFRQAADFMEDNISGMTNISIAVKSGVSQGINDPEFIRTLGAFTTWLRAQPETDHVTTLADTYARLNMNMHGDDPHFYRLPADQALAAQYLLLYEMSLPYGLDLNNEINIDKSSVKLLLTTENLGSKDMVALEQRIYQWFGDHAPQYTVLASSPNLMFSHIGEVNMTSMLQTLPVTLVFISLLLIGALRSWHLGAISLIPNLVPAVLGFGAWAMISGEINLGLSVVVTLTLGIVVDDCVHFLTKYQHARRQGKDVEAGIRYAFRTVGKALWVTTAVLVSGFLVLAMSSFRLNADLGLLSALVISIALVVDFIVLPAVLLMFDRKHYATQNEALDEIESDDRETVAAAAASSVTIKQG
ncbi:efflux RND transporter permease subunit [Photobacterium japonica]|uniref:efflux RND transporter permease subunit n=1 Tax=Photobacterium japonica TaxID=2910235 RepID=UPI003D0E5FB2